MQDEAFFSQVLELKVDDLGQQAVLRDLQRHPANDKVIHVDFMRVRDDAMLSMRVPLHFLGEDHCVGVRQGGGSLSHNLIEVEISSLPADLPEYIEVDVAELEVGTSVHLSDISLPPRRNAGGARAGAGPRLAGRQRDSSAWRQRRRGRDGRCSGG